MSSALPENMGHFRLTRSVEIAELRCVLHELVHAPSGAQVIHIANDDDENLFCLSLQTLPTSSNGVAHILEHTVLCGSEKFPVRDPFFAMSRRSLNTFMNALTGSDFTCYPAASQVAKDFYNLLEVYLDAVFRPKLRLLSFLQEGHRLEFATPHDPASPLEYKGIVYSEMKGAMSQPDARLWQATMQQLFPDLCYRFQSGGLPAEIPSLTYADLLNFHKSYYHPSRALFFFYGNMPLANHLQFLEEQLLAEVKPVPPLPPIPRQARFSVPRLFSAGYPIAPGESTAQKSLISLSWLTCSLSDQIDLLALLVLDIILMGTDAAPLKHALLASGLCKQASSSIDDGISEIPFVLTLKGCEPTDAAALQAIVSTTLHELASQGIPLRLIEGAIHQMEFYRSEITGDYGPFGLTLFMRSGLLKQHGGQPENGLKIHSLFAELRERCKDSAYLSGLLHKYLLDNPHHVCLILKPDAQLASQENQEERQKLDLIQANLNEKTKQALVAQAKELTAFQETQEKESLDVLPKVTLQDVPQHPKEFTLEQEQLAELTLFHHDCFTNQIIYADLIFDLPYVAEEDLPYLRLFTALFSQVGCGKRAYKENLEYIQEHLGGVGASLFLNVQAADHHRYVPTLAIRGKALTRKADKLFPLLRELVESLNFDDVARIKQLITQTYVGLENNLASNAMRYAINLSASQWNSSSRLNQLWHGLDYYTFIRKIAQNLETEAPRIRDKLQLFAQQLLGLKNAHLVLGCDKATYQLLKSARFYGLAELQLKNFNPWIPPNKALRVASQGRRIASPVAFNALVFETLSYNHPDSAVLAVLGTLFDNVTMHRRIREQGGAYGCGAVAATLGGQFYFYSHRDPNLLRTRAAFEEAVQDVLHNRFSERDLEEAKLGVIQRLDSPMAPGSRALTAYSWLREGKTFEMRNQFRQRLLQLTATDLKRLAENVVLPGLTQGAFVSFAGEALLEAENKALIAQGKTPLSVESI